jgi:hypothetical protein
MSTCGPSFLSPSVLFLGIRSGSLPFTLSSSSNICHSLLLQFTWSSSHFTIQPLPAMHPVAPLIPFFHVSSSSDSTAPHRFLLHPRGYSPVTLLPSPHLPRWPPNPSFKPFSYSRWQREKSSTSQSAELARSSSIPRKQLLRRLVVVRHRLCHNGDVLQ